MSLSDRATGIASALQSWPRRRVQLTELWELLDTADPQSRSFLHRRQLLADALAELTTAGLVTLPSAGSYDRTEQPSLPRFISLPAPAHAEEQRRIVVWHPMLAWAAETVWPPRHYEVLTAVNRWLFSGPGELVIPLRERSIEILGNEKAFDRLILTGLFAPGRLSMDLLKARRIAPPMHTVHVGDGDILLVVENSDTFDSLVTVLRTSPGQVGSVGWGAGAAFEASVLSVSKTVGRIKYFGDLDAKGLQTPANASLQAQTVGLPTVEAADGLYGAMREVGLKQQHRAGTANSMVHVNWLPARHHDWAHDVLSNSARVAQESVGLAYLLRKQDWRSDLT